MRTSVPGRRLPLRGHLPLGLAGAALANLATVADGIDGELARAKGIGSPGGYVLDNLCDRVRDSAVIAGCGIGAARAGAPGAYAWTVAALGFYLLFFYLSSISPAHWGEARTETDLGDKHLLAWTRIHIGIGDSLAAIVAASAIAGRPELIVYVIAITTPFVAGLKIRHLRRLRPWGVQTRGRTRDIRPGCARTKWSPQSTRDPHKGR